MASYKPGPFRCESSPKDFTVTAAAGPEAALAETAPAFVPPENPTRWQRVLLFLRGILAWLLEIIERQLAA